MQMQFWRMSKMTKYIVSGYIGFDNFGDEAIAKVLTDKLKNEGAEKITLISSNPVKTSEKYDVNSCGRFSFINDLLESDVLISGGGSLLQDVTSLKSLIYYIGIIALALLFGKKVIIYAQGIGPINSFWGKFFSKLALKYSDEISVRDKGSQELLKSWGIEADLVQDPIFSLNLSPKNKQGVIGVQLRQFATLTDIFMESLAKFLAQKFPDKSFQIISLQDSLDLNVCEKFENLLRKNGITNVKTLNNLDFENVIETISNLELLIGMRFHANVVGLKTGVKTVPINYDPKVRKLADEYHLQCIELDQTDFDGILTN